MDGDKLYLAFPYVLLVGVAIRMVQSDFDGFAVFLCIMLVLICALTTWLLLRPDSPPAEQAPASKPAEPVKPLDATKLAEPAKEVPAMTKTVQRSTMPEFLIRDGVLIHYYGHASHVTVPEGVHTIGENAFAAEPNRVTEESIPPMYWDQYGADPFTGKATVVKNSIPGNNAIRRVTLPAGVKVIRQHAFYKCANLEAVELPDSLTFIGHLAFGNCAKLSSIHLPQGVRLDMNPFEGCPAAIQQAANALRRKGTAALTPQPAKEVPMHKPADLPKPPTPSTLPDDDPGFLIRDDVLVYYYGHAPVVRVPNGVRVIGTHAFASRPSEEIEASIPPRYRAQYHTGVLDRIAPLVKGQIPGNPYIQQVLLPKSVKRIELRGFYMCANLTAVELPRNLEFIGHSAFSGCTNLTSINLPKNAYRCGNPFESCNKEIYAAVRALEQEKKAALKPKPEPLKRPATEDVPATGPTIQTADFDIRDGILLRYKGRDSHVVVPEGVHTIGKHAFVHEETRTYTTTVPPMFHDYYGADSSGHAEVTRTIYSGIASLRSVTLPEGLQIIGEEAFLKCENLQEINLPQSLQRINHGAFRDCRSLQRVALPQHVYLEGSVFLGCRDEVILAAYKHRERSASATKA